MSRIVIDASTTLRWLFNEESDAEHIKQVLNVSELVAPWLWQLEVTNTILVRERRKVLSAALASQLLALIDELPIDLVNEPISATALAASARPHQLTAYDASYLNIAIRLGIPLFTQDGNLRIAAQRAGIPLVPSKTPPPRRNK